jgi:hypothetical protein
LKGNPDLLAQIEAQIRANAAAAAGRTKLGSSEVVEAAAQEEDSETEE